MSFSIEFADESAGYDARIKVIGCGGSGGNAVNTMINFVLERRLASLLRIRPGAEQCRPGHDAGGHQCHKCSPHATDARQKIDTGLPSRTGTRPTPLGVGQVPPRGRRPDRRP